MAAHLLGGASCAHRAMRPPVGRQCCLPAASSLRHDSGSHQLGRRLQRRNGDPAVEPAAALGAAAAERNASSSGPSLLQHAPSSSSNNHSSSSSSTTLGMPCRQQRLRVAVDVDEGGNPGIGRHGGSGPTFSSYRRLTFGGCWSVVADAAVIVPKNVLVCHTRSCGRLCDVRPRHLSPSALLQC
jgi:hypothetical protein